MPRWSIPEPIPIDRVLSRLAADSRLTVRPVSRGSNGSELVATGSTKTLRPSGLVSEPCWDRTSDLCLKDRPGAMINPSSDAGLGRICPRTLGPRRPAASIGFGGFQDSTDTTTGTSHGSAAVKQARASVVAADRSEERRVGKEGAAAGEA